MNDNEKEKKFVYMLSGVLCGLIVVAIVGRGVLNYSARQKELAVQAAYAAAMALVAWVRSLDVRPRNSVQALAVAESLALMNDRLSRAAATRSDPALSLALDRLIEGKAAAA